MKYIICPRCSGHGKIEKYNHVEDGLCFECHGAGRILVDDNTPDIIAEIRKERKEEKELNKEFNTLWEIHKSNILNDRDWKNYILCEATENTTKDEERLIRINQYIEHKRVWKEYISKHMELMDDIEQYKLIKNEFESKYLISRE